MITTPNSLYRHHRFPAEVIAHAVWLYFRFPLSLRVLLENHGWANLRSKMLPKARWIMASENIDALFVIAHEAAPSHHPTEGSFHHPASGKNLEALDPSQRLITSMVRSEVGGFVHQLSPIINAIGEEMLDPGPALANPIEDRLGSRAVGDLGGRKIDH
jgi:hypothetical protein